MLPFADGQEVVVRVVSVPTAAHHTIDNPKNISFLEHIAKNVGIRASRGEFVAVTNPDILLRSCTCMLA
jgi:hypothetical protein